MIYAQILNGIIVNIIQLEDSSLVSLFSQGYDSCIQIDNLTPIPAIGWYYDIPSTSFYSPATLALIQNNLVTSIIQNCAAYITNEAANYQAIIDITNLSSPPLVGFTYNSDGTFTASAAYYQALVAAATSFGQKLVVQYAAQNVAAGITQVGKTLALITYMSTLSVCLNTGSLYEAINQINIMIADTSDTKANLSPFVTNDILYTYLNLIQTYLSVPLTPNPGS